MNYLDGYEDKDAKFEVLSYDQRKHESFDWRDVMKDHDIVYFNYTTNDIGYAVMGTMAQKFGCKLVVDFDDDIFSILSDNPAHEIFKEGSWGREVAKAIIKDVSHVTCTNNHLRHSLAFHSKVDESHFTVIPNYIDLSLYKHRCKFKDRQYYVGLHFGSTTHFSSLQGEVFLRSLDRIMKEYPNFTFNTVGAAIGSFADKWGMRYKVSFGDSDLMTWISKMPEFMDNADFMIVPLINNTYNRSKSSIKYLEASSYKIPGCYQNIRQYNSIIENGVDGILCSTEDEWYNGIKEMLNNSKLRKEMGEKAFKKVKDNFQIQDHIHEYADMFKKVLDF